MEAIKLPTLSKMQEKKCVLRVKKYIKNAFSTVIFEMNAELD